MIYGIALSFLLPVCLFAQRPVRIGAHEIKVGMSLDAAKASLSRDYTLIPVGKESPPKSWVVAITKDGSPVDVVGTLFSGGSQTVTGVSKSEHADTIQSLFDKLFSAINDFESSPQRPTCGPTTWTNYVEGTSIAGIRIQCDLNFSIRVVRSAYKGSGVFYEVWEDVGDTAL